MALEHLADAVRARDERRASSTLREVLEIDEVWGNAVGATRVRAALDTF